MKRLFAAAWLLLLCVAVQAQEFTPPVRSFTKIDYMADSQNWAVASDGEGIVYVGNNRGLLSFDGYRWELHQLPSNQIVRSVLVQGDRIYVGSYEEFGYFQRSVYGRMEYTSLSARLEDYDMRNDEIWRILLHDGRIIFQAFRSWFILEPDGEVKAVRSDGFVEFFSELDGRVYASEQRLGFSLVDLDGGALEKVPGVPFGGSCISILPGEDGGGMLVTYSEGLYSFADGRFARFRTEADALLRTAQVNKAVRTPAGDMIIGTRLSGTMCIDSAGKLLWHMSSRNVLSGNTVLDLALDARGNLWMAMGSGVAMASLGSNLSVLGNIEPSIGDIYTAAAAGQYLYLGTSQGLFRAGLDGNSIRSVSRVPSIGSHVFSLSAFDGQLFAGTGGHGFEISGNHLRDVCPVNGGAAMDKGVINDTEVLVQATYTNLCIYLRKNGKWAFSHALYGFVEPVTSLKVDYKGTIWAGHMHGGLYAIRLAEDLRSIASIDRYETLDGESRLPVRVLSIGSRVVFTDGVAGFCTYDDLLSRIVPYEDLNRALSGFSPFFGIVRASADIYWFTSEREALLARWKDGGLEVLDVVPYRMLGGRTPDAGERIVPLSGDSYLFTLENALALYKPRVDGEAGAAYPELRPVSIRVSDRRKAGADSLLNLGISAPRLPYRFGGISFRLAYPVSGFTEDVRHRAYLEGLDPDWKELRSAPEASYSYLPSGRYVFHIQARAYDGTVLSSWDWPFRIKPPFWRSGWAYALYAAILALIALGTANYFITRNREQLERLEREKLESEVKLKSKELAASTMELVRKREVLIELRDEKDPRRIRSIIDSQLRSDDDWAVFEKNFDNIHENFFANLRRRYPALTDTDLRFCAYLHLNLTSKDIASLMNISLKGVEAARSRIRKKIQLPSDKSLTAFMIELK